MWKNIKQFISCYLFNFTASLFLLSLAIIPFVPVLTLYAFEDWGFIALESWVKALLCILWLIIIGFLEVKTVWLTRAGVYVFNEMPRRFMT